MIGSTAHDAPSDTDPSPPPPTARVAAPAAPVDEDDSEIETLRHRILELEGQIAAEPMAGSVRWSRCRSPATTPASLRHRTVRQRWSPLRDSRRLQRSCLCHRLTPPSSPRTATRATTASCTSPTPGMSTRSKEQLQWTPPGTLPLLHHRVRHRSSIPVKRKKKKEKKRRSASISSSVHRVVRVKATDKKLGSWPTTVQFAAWRRALRLAVAGSCDEPDMAKKWIFEVKNRDADIAHFKSSRKDTLRARRQVG